MVNQHATVIQRNDVLNGPPSTDREGSKSVLPLGVVLTAATVGLWLLLAYPAWKLSGMLGLEGLTYAALLCLVPGWLVFSIASRYRVASVQTTIALMGAVVRMLVVLLGTLLIQSLRPELGFREFLVWVIVFYLVTLGVETYLLVKQLNTRHSE